MSIYDQIHAALRAAQSINRLAAEQLHSAIARHEAAGSLTAKEARTLRWMLWGAALDPFAATDPAWLTALKPENSRRTF
ncbi:hypothetical protein ACFW4T_28605 [Streptomyces mutabilis]|uniref:hypothetical protein n=1 Tax=Streptomyces mutabilis TaxID=67332 RepID=UPI0036B7C4FC